MYDKSGLVLRVETVINNPEEFRVRKQVLRKGKRRTEWVEMRKGVAYLFRYREVSLQANGRYLDALAVVDDPTNAKRDLNRVTTPKKVQRAVGGPVSTRSHAMTLNYSRPSWPASIACEASPTTISGHGLHRRFNLRTCRHDPKKESAKVSRTFRASTLTA
ncbi:MAG: hypothetical protein ACHBNF_09370 [Chromatiales bacterium]